MTRKQSGPVFVLGPARAGTNLVAWSLGQHRDFSTLPDGRWLVLLATQLASIDHMIRDHAHESRFSPPAEQARGIHGALAQLANDLLNQRKSTTRRLVASPPEAAVHAVALSTLFPGARFIHVVRDVRQTIALLTQNEVSKLYGTYHSPHRAYEHWLRITKACIAAEEALGPGEVLRLHYGDLLAEPAIAMRRCLEFLGESWDDHCLRIFHGLSGMPNVTEREEVLQYRVRREANDLYDMLSTVPQPDRANVDRLEELQAAARQTRYAFAGEDDSHSSFRQLVGLVDDKSARVLVVSRGDDRLVNLVGQGSMHFPRTPDGKYIGYHPKDSAQAIEFLAAERRLGATHLAFPSSSSWWLDHYSDLRDYLNEHASVVAHVEDVGTVFDLRSNRRRSPAFLTPRPISSSVDSSWFDRLGQLEERLEALRCDVAEGEREFWVSEAIRESGVDVATTVDVSSDTKRNGEVTDGTLPRRVNGHADSIDLLLSTLDQEAAAGARYVVVAEPPLEAADSELCRALLRRYPMVHSTHGARVFALSEQVETTESTRGEASGCE